MAVERDEVRAHVFRVFELVYGEPPESEAVNPYDFDRDVGELMMAIEETFGVGADGNSLAAIIDKLVGAWDGETLNLPPE